MKTSKFAAEHLCVSLQRVIAEAGALSPASVHARVTTSVSMPG